MTFFPFVSIDLPVCAGAMPRRQWLNLTPGEHYVNVSGRVFVVVVAVEVVAVVATESAAVCEGAGGNKIHPTGGQDELQGVTCCCGGCCWCCHLLRDCDAGG